MYVGEGMQSLLAELTVRANRVVKSFHRLEGKNLRRKSHDYGNEVRTDLDNCSQASLRFMHVI